MDRRMDRDGQCPAPDRGRGERSSPVGSWPRRGLGVRARRGGVACLGGAPEWGGGFAGSCSPTVGDRDPTGSPAAPPTPPPRQHCKGHKGFAGGLVGGGGLLPQAPHPLHPISLAISAKRPWPAPAVWGWGPAAPLPAAGGGPGGRGIPWYSHPVAGGLRNLGMLRSGRPGWPGGAGGCPALGRPAPT